MHAMLGVLAKWNQFRYLKLEPSLVKFFDGEKMSKLIITLQERKKVIISFEIQFSTFLLAWKFDKIDFDFKLWPKSCLLKVVCSKNMTSQTTFYRLTDKKREIFTTGHVPLFANFFSKNFLAKNRCLPTFGKQRFTANFFL